MESTGKSNQIQVSEATADLILASGKSHWMRKRDDLVQAKGKGAVQTYWIKSKTSSSSPTERSNSIGSSVTAPMGDRTSREAAKLQRKRRSLIDWQVELLSRLLKQILLQRESTNGRKSVVRPVLVSKKMLPRDEIAEKIEMPGFSAEKAKKALGRDSVDLPDKVVAQLDDLLTTISHLYHDNSFHNYEHACHVTMSANKLLNRIVTPASQENGEFLKEAHDYTYGLTSDPLTQFAIVFSTIIHDLDHSGVSNQQLIKEKNRLAVMYKDKSVAEQNSIDLAFEILTSSSYSELVSCICGDDNEYKRFRQLVINCVMATDM